MKKYIITFILLVISLPVLSDGYYDRAAQEHLRDSLMRYEEERMQRARDRYYCDTYGCDTELSPRAKLFLYICIYLIIIYFFNTVRKRLKLASEIRDDELECVYEGFALNCHLAYNIEKTNMVYYQIKMGFLRFIFPIIFSDSIEIDRTIINPDNILGVSSINKGIAIKANLHAIPIIEIKGDSESLKNEILEFKGNQE